MNVIDRGMEEGWLIVYFTLTEEGKGVCLSYPTTSNFV